ncbi:ABC-three component system middle component 7 [Gimesia sp.]|uniref:ABC-three component system middle component 7 n=1 Tax=Gimesia sp. TaxID=2024833 RepID=UPI003A910E39
MIVPNKFTSLDQSLLSQLPLILEELENEVTVYDLYRKTQKNFEDIGEFILALDSLFVLGRIELDVDKESIKAC